jgi:RHH-type proline utilization regulon transcriptional repressor/proline dehydrogenase/delta 1-pyrroline-5-carboxylate dehydrogenase
MRLPEPYRAENEVVAQHLASLENALDWQHAMHSAHPWIATVRQHPPVFWALERLLTEYPISSAEGLALMRLAEALLRIPDAETAVALTTDQLSHADFQGSGNSVLARISRAVITLSKQLLPELTASRSSWLGQAGAQAVVAATLRAVQLLGQQFVLGETLPDAHLHAQRLRKRHPTLRFSFDMLGEGARTAEAAQRYWQHYADAIDAIASQADARKPCAQQDGISVKLSALHPRFEYAQWSRLQADLLPALWSLCHQAARANIPFTIDAEETERLELSLKVMEALLARVAQQHPQWCGLGMAIQAYQTRSLEWVQHVIALARHYGVRLMCRLVKGAYWDAEIKRAQELGLAHYPVFTHKHHTDIAYLACAHAMLEAPEQIYPQFASHNAATIAAVTQMAARTGAAFELQRLHGMGEGVYHEVLKNPAIACRVYAPVGAHKDLLAYLVRRMLENGANASFVHQLTDPTLSISELLASPLHLASEPSLQLPPALFGTLRNNSIGLDCNVDSHRAPLLAAYATTKMAPVAEYCVEDVPRSFETSAQAATAWRNTTVIERAHILRQASNLLQQRMPYFCAILVQEARKTWQDAIAEVREAIDFLRYYAQEAERSLQPLSLPGPTGESNTLKLQPRGTWVCISPWNFPLAIFIGQVAAALVTGNTVLAKPAEQTPFVAQEATQLLHEAGVPDAVLQLVVGSGESVGAALVAHPDVAGVAFTGSTQVAKSIQRALAAKDGPIIPLIAETGGINAMIVDSSALPEQVCDAVIHSAFRSAGQRCSGLRLLCVHSQIADTVLSLIQGATKELICGNPAHFDTDVGPLIDAHAHATVQNHLQRLYTQALPLLHPAEFHTLPDASVPNLLAPALFEVSAIHKVTTEIFGPVLQIVRWQGDVQQVMHQINRLGYGLTLGIQTRIDHRAQQLAHTAKVGNVYINRNQIGAVVGVQPFGGQGLSGTGPKAGGPHYLARFCTEQTLTINTTAAGGNAQLLTMHTA